MPYPKRPAAPPEMGSNKRSPKAAIKDCPHLEEYYVALQETASPFKSYVGEVQHLLTSEQNYPRKAPSLGMMRDIFVIHDESMLPVKRPQDAGNGLPGVMFFFATHATCRTAGARRLHAHRLSAAADRTCGTRHHCLESATADAILPSIDLPLLRRPPAAKKPTEVGFAVGAD